MGFYGINLLYFLGMYLSIYNYFSRCYSSACQSFSPSRPFSPWIDNPLSPISLFILTLSSFLSPQACPTRIFIPDSLNLPILQCNLVFHPPRTPHRRPKQLSRAHSPPHVVHTGSRECKVNPLIDLRVSSCSSRAFTKLSLERYSG